MDLVRGFYRTSYTFFYFLESPLRYLILLARSYLRILGNKRKKKKNIVEHHQIIVEITRRRT